MLTPTLNLPTITQEVALNTIRFNRAFGDFENRISQIGHRMTNIGIAASLAVSIPLQVMAAAAVKSFSDLDNTVTTAFSKIQGAGLGVKEAISNTATEMSLRTATSANDLAKGINELVASGYSAQQSIAALGTANKFAVAGEIDMAKSTGTLIAVMASLGLRTENTAKNMEEMSRIASVLVKAADETQVGVSEFADALTHKALTAMKQVNMSLEEGTAVLMTYATRGIQGARAGEYFNIMLRDMQVVALKNADTWRRWGLEVYDAQGQIRPVAELIGMLEKKFAGASDQQLRSGVTMLGFKDKSLIATQALLGASEQIDNFKKVLEAAGPILEDTYRVRMTSFANQMQITKNHVSAVARDMIGQLIPAVSQVGIAIRGLSIQWLMLDDAQKQTAIRWLVMAAAAGPLLIVTGVMVRTFGILINLGIRLAVVFAFMAVGMARAAIAAAMLGARLLYQVAVGLSLAAIMALQFGVQLYQTGRLIVMCIVQCGLLQGGLALLTRAYRVVSMTAIVAWLSQAGPIALLIIAVDVLIYLLTGKDGLQWAFEGLGYVADKVFAGMESAMDAAASKIQDKIGGITGGIDKFMEQMTALDQFQQGKIHPAGLMGTAAMSGGLATAAGPMFAAGMASIMTGGLGLDAMGDMSQFDNSSFKDMQKKLEEEFDASLLEKEDDKKNASQRSGYSAYELGTAEEYKARISGTDNAQMLQMQKQQVAVANKQADIATQTLETIKEMFENDKSQRGKAINARIANF